MRKRKKYKRFDRVKTFKIFGWTIRISRDKPEWKYKKSVKADAEQLDLLK